MHDTVQFDSAVRFVCFVYYISIEAYILFQTHLPWPHFRYICDTKQRLQPTTAAVL